MQQMCKMELVLHGIVPWSIFVPGNFSPGIQIYRLLEFPHSLHKNYSLYGQTVRNL